MERPPGTFSKRDWKTPLRVWSMCNTTSRWFNSCPNFIPQVGGHVYNPLVLGSRFHSPSQKGHKLAAFSRGELSEHFQLPGPGPSPTSLRILWTVPPNHVFQPPSKRSPQQQCFETKVKPLCSHKWCYNLTSMCSNEQFSGVNWQFQGGYYHLHPLLGPCSLKKHKGLSWFSSNLPIFVHYLFGFSFRDIFTMGFSGTASFVGISVCPFRSSTGTSTWSATVNS